MINENINYGKYVLYLHKNKETKEIFYVGIGTLVRANNFRERNFLWKSYVNKYGNPLVEIYKSKLTYLEALYLENFFITKMGRKIDNSGNLVNLSIGGEGGRGYKHTKEHREKLKESIKRNGYVAPKGEAHWNYGKKWSEETRKKISKAGKGRKQSQAHIDKRVAARRGKCMNSNSIAKMANTLKGRVLPKEVLEKMSVSIKKVWANPEYKKKMCDMRKGKIRNSREVIDNTTGIIYKSAKDAAFSLGYTVTWSIVTGKQIGRAHV